MYLLDVNTLVALLYSEHAHAPAALAWLSRQDAPGSIGICRVVEMGALRLMTRSAVMGANVLGAAEFRRGWDIALGDDRLVRLAESDGLTARWRQICSAIPGGTVADTDAYLAAFAIAGDLTLVTFDQGFARFAGLRVETLSRSC